ncbi:MAG: 50S ribosomal protein L9 [Sedimentisphaerales bacterium]|nr:50S ribosomal protein L9 [Sedimentisphaerales bacterium]
MKVLLVEDVEKLGFLGDIVEVRDGYARNYLLPQGLAQSAIEDNIKAIAEEKAKRAQERLSERKRMEKACAEVDGAEAVIASKANEQGHLFGSVTEKAIAENLRAQGFMVADEIVKMHGHIKEVGSHEVTVKFAEDLEAKVNVTVVAEGAELNKDNTETQAAEKSENAAEKDHGENSGTVNTDE